MVYHGDVTGGMLANLDNLALSSILPDIPITNAPFDMSHFMSMSMEVDESWMHVKHTNIHISMDVITVMIQPWVL